MWHGKRAILANEERAYTLLRNVRFGKLKNQEKF